MTPYLIILATYLIALPLANGSEPLRMLGQAAALLIIFAGIFAGFLAFAP